VTIAEDQDRLLEQPRRALERARRDPSVWAEFTCHPEPGGDVHSRARFGLLLALQYDRRESDLALARFLLRQQIVHCREFSVGYLPDNLVRAGLLVAEHRQAEDVWLHWEAKDISFDTALGYRTQLLLTSGVATVRDVVMGSTGPQRDRLLELLTQCRLTDADVETWLADQRRRFPGDPAAEDLETWSHHAGGLGDPAASRRFLLAWAETRPRTADTLRTLRFSLAGAGFLTEAIAVQREAVALAEPDDRSSALWTLAQLQREAGDVDGAWQSVRAAAADLPEGKKQDWPGLWCQVAGECFRLVPLTPAVTARAAFDLGEEVLRSGTAWWMNGAVEAMLEAAGHLGEADLLERSGELHRIAGEQQRRNIHRLE
jgi:hypothetical protein